MIGEMKMKLCQMLEGVSYSQIIGNKDIDIEMICYNSREAKNNGLFVAIDGFKVDGHAYVSNAIQGGCLAVLVEKDIEFFEGITVIQVEDSRKALAIITKNFYGKISDKINIFGITGTKGKTTTAHFIKSIFNTSNNSAEYIGTTTDFTKYGVSKNTPTTPESLEINKILSQIYNKKNNLIMEVTSHSLELNRVYGIPFKMSVFTNLTEDHLDFHKNMGNYFAAKAKLFLQTTECAIVNYDDEYGKKLIDICNKKGLRVISFGFEKEADYYADDIEIKKEYTKFKLIGDKLECEIKLPLMGKFNILNALAAAAIGINNGISIEDVKYGLENIEQINGRVEKFKCSKGFDVIIDFAHTPDSLKKITEAAINANYKRVVLVFGLGGERYKAKRPKMGEIAGKLATKSILTEDNSRSESTLSILKDIAVGIEKVNGKYEIIEDRDKAIKKAIFEAKDGDVILLLGKGHEKYQLKNGKKTFFDEHLLVKKYIEMVEEK
jgi:UDP-N-acetylmuramyl-tripeptide synthetase